MRWRPTLVALGVLAVVAALAVAMSSASSPSLSASVDDPTLAAGGEPSPDPPAAQPAVAPVGGGPVDGPDADTAVPEEDRAETLPLPGEPVEEDPPDEPEPADEDPADSTDEGGGSAPPNSPVPDPARSTDDTAIPTICPDPADSFFNIYTMSEDCYFLLIRSEEHEELTAEELELTGAVPFVAGDVAEPLGRPARTIRRGPPGEAGAPRFYLTFDDGPSTRWTRPTLDLLDRYGARATFFPVGAYAEVNFHLIEEIVARGHTIGSHLWSHERAALNSEELFRRELRASAELFGELGTNCLRTPFGAVNDDILEWAGDEGFEVVLWGEPDPRDWEFPGLEELTRSMLGMQNGSILILHEHTGADTLAALDAVLETLDARGWSFDEPICPLQF